MEWKGYTGNILNVNLTDNKIWMSKQDLNDISKFIGGFGINTKLAVELIKPNIDPLSEENILVFATHVLNQIYKYFFHDLIYRRSIL